MFWNEASRANGANEASGVIVAVRISILSTSVAALRHRVAEQWFSCPGGRAPTSLLPPLSCSCPPPSRFPSEEKKGTVLEQESLPFLAVLSLLPSPEEGCFRRPLSDLPRPCSRLALVMRAQPLQPRQRCFKRTAVVGHYNPPLQPPQTTLQLAKTRGGTSSKWRDKWRDHRDTAGGPRCAAGCGARQLTGCSTPSAFGLPSRRREFCHSAAPPSACSSYFNSDGEGMSAK